MTRFRRWGLALLLGGTVWAAPVKARYDIVLVYDSGMAGTEAMVQRMEQGVEKACLDLRVPSGQLPVLVIDVRKTPGAAVRLGIQPDQLPAMAAATVGHDGRPDKVLKVAIRADLISNQDGLTSVLATALNRLGKPMPLLGLGGVDPKSPAAQAFHPREAHGIVILRILPDSPASTTGIQAGDVLLQVDGVPVTSPAQMQTLIRSHRPGDKIFLQYDHRGTLQMTSVHLSAAK